MRIPSTAAVAAATMLLAASLAAARDSPDCPSDPYVSQMRVDLMALAHHQVDPSHDTCNPLRYVPNKAINIAAAVLYFVVALALTWRTWQHKGYYMLCLVIGAYCEGIGLAIRLGLRQDLHSTGYYIAMYLFVVLSPCAFLAGDYILLGRIVKHFDGDRYLFLRPDKISWIFITSDIITFLIQAAGGGLSTSNMVSTAEAGGHIFLAGIAIQMASFLLFTALWAVYIVRVYRHDPDMWARPGWKKLYFALGFTCICFLIRSVYRTVELSQGYIGYLATHERYFLGLDTLPLWLGILVYTWFWPAKYLTPATRVARDSALHMDGSANTSHELEQAYTGSVEEPKRQ